MTHQTKTIRRLSDLPKWFALEKYDGSKKLNAVGWYEQLSVREKVFRFLKSITAIDFPSEDFAEANESLVQATERIQMTPIFDATEDEVLRNHFYDYRLFELKNRNPRDSFGVRLLSMRDLYWMERHIEHEKRVFIRDWSAQFDDPDWGDVTSEKNLIEYQEWFGDPVDSYVESKAFGYTVRINPLLPENVLVEQFKGMLHALRGQEFSPPPRPNFANWVRFGVLPYIDLWLWACVTGTTIPNRVMADAIFAPGEGGEEVVRKTTSNLMVELISSPNLDTLAAIGAAEIAEKKWA